MIRPAWTSALVGGQIGVCFLVGVSTASFAAAQALTWTDVRVESAATVGYSRVLPNGVTELGSLGMSAPNAILEWVVESPLTAHARFSNGSNPVTLTLPFNFPGGISQLSGNRFLVTGADSVSSAGWMAVVAMNGSALGGRSLTLQQSASIGSAIDPIECCWDHASQSLVLFDYRQDRLLLAPWDGLGPMPTASMFQQLSLGLPLGPGLRLQASPNGGVEVWEAGGRIMARIQGDGAGGWLAVPTTSLAESLEVHNAAHLVAGEDVFFRMAQPGLVELQDASSGAVIAAKQVSAPGAWHSFPGQLFAPNHAYRFSIDGIVGFARYLPDRRWGDFSASTAATIACGRGHFTSWPRVGNANFALGGWVALRDPVAVPSEQVFVVLALGLDNGVPAIATGGGFTPMANPLVIWGPLPFLLTEQAPAATFSFLHPVPNDAGLVGTRPIYQWVAVTVGGQLAGSDVFGAVVFP